MLSPAAFTSGAVALAVATALTSAAPPTGPTASAQRPAATIPAAPATQDARTQEAPAQDALAQKPYMGWTSWTMQSSKYPGLNPRGDYSYLTEANVLKQADAMAAKLKPYGYEYVNIDAGWWRDWDWKPHFDEYGRQQADPERFPSGMKYGGRPPPPQGPQGRHLPAGRPGEGGLRRGQGSRRERPRLHHRRHRPQRSRTTNGWDSAYKIDFSQACAQKYVDSQAQLFADWGYDFLKLDGVGPGSFKSGDNYDNRADIAAWQQAIATAGRPIHLELSWSLDVSTSPTGRSTPTAGGSTPTSSATATRW